MIKIERNSAEITNKNTIEKDYYKNCNIKRRSSTSVKTYIRR